jgi:hypothetical protein
VAPAGTARRSALHEMNTLRSIAAERMKMFKLRIQSIDLEPT